MLILNIVIQNNYLLPLIPTATIIFDYSRLKQNSNFVKNPIHKEKDIIDLFKCHLNMKNF